MKDFQKINLVKGKIKESKTDLKNLTDFIERWKEKIRTVKTLSLSNKQAYYIANGFLEEAHSKFFYKDSIKNKTLVLDQVGNDLFMALFQANNKYREELGFWSIFLKKLKLPPLHYHKN